MRNAPFIVALSLALAWGVSAAQQASTKQLRIVVSTPPGSTPDIVMRLVAPKVGERLQRPVVVENRVGVNGALAVQTVAAAEPDGATLLVAPSGTVTVNPLIYRQLPNDPARDLAPVIKLADLDFVLLSRPGLPGASVAKLRDLSKAQTGGLSAAIVAPGTIGHLALALLQQRTGIAMTMVPFKGSPQAAQAVAAGDADLQLETLAVTESLIKAGRLVPIAVTGSTRNPLLPDVPTMREWGVPDFEVVAWNGVFAPAKTPAPTVNQIASAFTDALSTPEVAKRLGQMGLRLSGLAGAEFNKRWETETDMWREVVRRANIKIE